MTKVGFTLSLINCILSHELILILQLLTINPTSPVTFSNARDLTGLFRGLPNGQAHNVVVNEEKNYAVAVGAQPRTSACKGGLIFINLTNPALPTTPGCAAQDGYVHDAQCLVYRGPDTRYTGKDICKISNVFLSELY